MLFRVLAGACALAVVSLGLNPAAAQEEDNPIDPAEVVSQIKEAYAAIFDRPQRITQRYETTTRQEGQPDIQTEGVITYLQQGEKVRGEIDVDSVTKLSETGENELLDLPAQTTFVQTEDRLTVWHPGEDGGTLSYYVNEDELGEFATSMMGERATLQFFDAMLEGGAVAREEFFQGRSAITLRSSEPFPVGPISTADAKFWIDTETMLVEYMEVDFRTEVELPAEMTSWTSMEADFEYEMDVEIGADAFDVETHDQAENFSDEVQEMARGQQGGE